MIKKCLLNMVATIVLFNVCDIHVSFAIDGGPRTDRHGCIMKPVNLRQIPLLERRELDEQRYRRQSEYAPYYPLFDIASDTHSKAWKNYQVEDFKRIFDGQGSGIDRLKAFDRLSRSVESELIITRHPELCSIQYNEEHVATVRWLAKAVLWHDNTMNAGQSTSFNLILTKILRHAEDDRKIYDNYLDRIYGHLSHAVRIQKHLIQTCSGEERFLSVDLPTFSNARRILGILKADQARVYELKLLKRKRDVDLDLSDPGSNNIVDRFQLLRKDAYDLYAEASDCGSSKLCILQRMKLIDEQGYSPTGNKERDEAILLDLGTKYLHENEDSVEEPAIRTQARIVAASGRNKILGAIPKPNGARDYIARIFAKHSIGKLPIRHIVSVPGAVELSDDEFAGSVVVLNPSSVYAASSENMDLVVSGGGQAAGFANSLVIDTSDLGIGSSSARTDEPLICSFAKSPHLSSGKQEEIRTYFAGIGGRDGAISRYGSLEKAYKSIGEEFGITKFQVSYALFRQAKYAEKRKAAALSISNIANEDDDANSQLSINDEDDNEETQFDDSLSGKKKKARKCRRIIVSDDEELTDYES